MITASSVRIEISCESALMGKGGCLVTCYAQGTLYCAKPAAHCPPVEDSFSNTPTPLDTSDISLIFYQHHH